MAVRSMAATNFPHLAWEHPEERERTISGPQHNHLGAFRGFAFAMLIEGSLALMAGIGWELWKFLR